MFMVLKVCSCFCTSAIFIQLVELRHNMFFFSYHRNDSSTHKSFIFNIGQNSFQDFFFISSTQKIKLPPRKAKQQHLEIILGLNYKRWHLAEIFKVASWLMRSDSNSNSNTHRSVLMPNSLEKTFLTRFRSVCFVLSFWVFEWSCKNCFWAHLWF